MIGEELPQDGRTYQCELCRLELVFDGLSERLRVPSYESETDSPIAHPVFDRRRELLLVWPAESERRRGPRRRADQRRRTDGGGSK